MSGIVRPPAPKLSLIGRLKGALVPSDAAPEETANYRNLIWDAFWIGIFNGLVGTFTNVFVIRLGAPNIYLGWMASIPAILTAMLSLPSMPLVQHFSARRVRLVTWGRIFTHLAYLTIAFFPFFLGYHATALTVVLMVILGSLPGGLLSIAVTSVLAAVMAPENRSRVMGARLAVMGATTAISVVVGGALLDHLPFPYNYQLLFLIAGAASFASIYYYDRLRIPQGKLHSESQPASSSVRSLTRLPQSLAELGRHRAFLIYAVSYLIYHLGIFGAHPLFSIYWVRELRLSDASVGLLTTANTLATVLAYVPWGQFTDRRGNRIALILGSFSVAFYPILIGLSRTMGPLVLVSFCVGIFGAGWNIAAFNVLIEVTPEQGRAPLLALHTIINNFAAFVAPLVTTALSQSYGVTTLLLAAGAVRLIGAGFFTLVPLPRPAAQAKERKARPGRAFWRR